MAYWGKCKLVQTFSEVNSAIGTIIKWHVFDPVISLLRVKKCKLKAIINPTSVNDREL